ncbi:MAG: hypothetical protein IPK19_09140 [Chloroflexi bacterium]|nr:hypothetical protein [Chloroflexota bacterium]
MRRILLLVGLLLTGVGVFAQSDASVTLIGLLQAGDFRALTVSNDDRYLLVTDAATNQIRIYELSDLADPPLITSVAVEGIPTGIASARGFLLVATRSGEGAGTIEILAPDRYSSDSPYAAGNNFVDLPFEIEDIIVSTDQDYAIAVGRERFSLLRLRSADEIDARNFNAALSAAAISSGVLYSAQGSVLSAARLDDMSVSRETTSLELGAPIVALAISENGQLGAIALENGDISFFDPEAFTMLSTVSAGGPPSELQFIASDAGPRLVAAVQGESALRLFDISQPEAVVAQEAQISLDGSIVGLTGFANHVIATDGSTIGIFELP